MIKIYNSKNIVIVILSVIAIFSFFNLGLINYNINTAIFGVARFNGPVITAVNRSLLLEDDYAEKPMASDIGYVDEGTGNWIRNPICTVDQIINGKGSFYSKCHFGGGGASGTCGAILSDPKCRSIWLSSSVWENEQAREKIIYASLNSCKFLFNPEHVKKEVFESRSTPRSEVYGYKSSNLWRHQQVWLDAGCAKGGDGISGVSVSTVFFEIYDVDKRRVNHQGLVTKVYKAELKNNVIEGGYIEL